MIFTTRNCQAENGMLFRQVTLGFLHEHIQLTLVHMGTIFKVLAWYGTTILVRLFMALVDTTCDEGCKSVENVQLADYQIFPNEYKHTHTQTDDSSRLHQIGTAKHFTNTHSCLTWVWSVSYGNILLTQLVKFTVSQHSQWFSSQPPSVECGKVASYSCLCHHHHHHQNIQRHLEIRTT